MLAPDNRRRPIMNVPSGIRKLVGQALQGRRLTPEIENAINSELTRIGYLPETDFEALELLMVEMDAGRIQLVPNY